MNLKYLLLISILVFIALILSIYILFMMIKNYRNMKIRLVDLLKTFIKALIFVFLHYPLFKLISNLGLPCLWPTHILGLFIIDIVLFIHAFSLKTLGSNWSDSSIPVKHAILVVTGPYAYVRHPIYSSFFFEGLCLILISPYFFLLGLWFIMIPFCRLVVKREEEELINFFGEEYKRYMQRVKYKIIPRIY